AEVRAAVVDATADHHEVLRYHLRANTPDASLKTDSRDVVLTTAIRTTANLDSKVLHSGGKLWAGSQIIADQPAEAARLGHCQAARLCPWAARHVGDGACTRQPQAHRRESPI